MDQQQRRQRDRDRPGRSRWRAGLVVGALLTLTACGGEPRDAPTGLDGGPIGPPGVGGGGGTVPTGGNDDVAGEWLNILFIRLNADYQRVETTWIFNRDGRCSRTVETYSALEDRLFRSARGCNYQVVNFEIAVLYDDAEETVDFDFQFVSFSRDRLQIDGFVFRRIF